MAHIIDVITNFILGSRETGAGVLDFVDQYLSLICSNPVLILFCIALPLVGLGIGLIRRLVSIRA